METEEETGTGKPRPKMMEESETLLERRKRLIEAALFMSAQAVSLHALSRILGTTFSETLEAVESLSAEYAAKNSALEIIREGGVFRMKVKAEYADAVSHLAVRPEFSKAVLRTLGLVAVKQPVRQSFVVKIVGNKAYDYVKALVGEGFISAKKAGNTKLLETTPKFKEYFGTAELKPGREQTLLA